jgi:hypothetical protein
MGSVGADQISNHIYTTEVLAIYNADPQPHVPTRPVGLCMGDHAACRIGDCYLVRTVIERTGTACNRPARS